MYSPVSAAQVQELKETVEKWLLQEHENVEWAGERIFQTQWRIRFLCKIQVRKREYWDEYISYRCGRFCREKSLPVT